MVTTAGGERVVTRIYGGVETTVGGAREVTTVKGEGDSGDSGVAVGDSAVGRGVAPQLWTAYPRGPSQHIPIRASKGMTCPDLREIGFGRGRGFSLVVFPTPLLIICTFRFGEIYLFGALGVATLAAGGRAGEGFIDSRAAVLVAF